MLGASNEDHADTPRVRPADLTGPDAESVGRLVEDYLQQTEREKAIHLGAGGQGGELPDRYRAEIDEPAQAYATAIVYLAELGDAAVGVVVVQQSPAGLEIKRVWVDPAARGLRVGSALLDAALSGRDLPVRLTVWDWRSDAVRLYEKRGFVLVDSWEERPRLLCMERRRQMLSRPSWVEAAGTSGS